MTELQDQIRDHVDAIAPPISIGEARERRDVDQQSARRGPLAAAAALIVAIGVGAVGFMVTEREPLGDDLAAPPEPAASSTSAPQMTIAPIGFIQVDVPGGLSVEQTGELLAGSVEAFEADVFVEAAEAALAESIYATDTIVDDIASSEGLLLPGTYDVSEVDSEHDLSRQMVMAMNDIGDELGVRTEGAEVGRSPYEILIIASLIEREANVAVDRGLISRVIHNRLLISDVNPDEPFPLQIDSAVLYGQEQLEIDPKLTFSQLRVIPSDWNTYLLPGLPATPIASPSRASIDAALHPTPNPGPTDPLCVDLENPDNCFLFFYVLGADDGSHVFAVTGEQHEANVGRARELGLL